MATGGIQIGKVAEETGLSTDAIRFYERQRLLERPTRTEGGFRLFGTQDIRRIQFIQRAQRLGFSLLEIRELLLVQGEDKDSEACSHVRDLLKGKIEIVRNKIAELASLEQQLATRLRKCEHSLKVSVEAHKTGCPVLEEIAHRKSDED